MNTRELDARPLFSEYETLVAESITAPDGEIDWAKLRCELVRTAEWTDVAAAHLVDLARSYGSFMLRNALALAVAAEVEDGALGH